MAEMYTTPSSAAQSFSHFLFWWRQQLKECVPVILRKKLAQARRPVMWSPTDDRVWPAAQALTQSQPFLNSALAQRGGAVALVVGEMNGFRRELEMPLAVQDRLQQVLGYELDRLTPLKASELYYDFRVRARNLAAGTCIVELAAAPRMRVDPMLEEANRRNLTVTRSSIYLKPRGRLPTKATIETAGSRQRSSACAPRWRLRWWCCRCGRCDSTF